MSLLSANLFLRRPEKSTSPPQVIPCNCGPLPVEQIDAWTDEVVNSRGWRDEAWLTSGANAKARRHVTFCLAVSNSSKFAANGSLGWGQNAPGGGGAGTYGSLAVAFIIPARLHLFSTRP